MILTTFRIATLRHQRNNDDAIVKIWSDILKGSI